MMKFVVLATMIAAASASGLLHAPAYAAVPAVAHTSAVVGSAVVGHQVHSQVHLQPKVISQPLHIVKPATYQISSGYSLPATGKVISAPIYTKHVVAAPLLAAPAYAAGPVLAHGAPYGAPLAHGYGH